MFINSDSVFFDFSKNIENMWLSGMGCTVCRIGNPFWFADGFTGVFPVLLLNSEINIGVRIGFPAFTFQDPARLTATTRITTAGNCITKCAIRILRVLFQIPQLIETLLVA